MAERRGPLLSSEQQQNVDPLPFTISGQSLTNRIRGSTDFSDDNLRKLEIDYLSSSSVDDPSFANSYKKAKKLLAKCQNVAWTTWIDLQKLLESLNIDELIVDPTSTNSIDRSHGSKTSVALKESLKSLSKYYQALIDEQTTPVSMYDHPSVSLPKQRIGSSIVGLMSHKKSSTIKTERPLISFVDDLYICQYRLSLILYCSLAGERDHIDEAFRPLTMRPSLFDKHKYEPASASSLQVDSLTALENQARELIHGENPYGKYLAARCFLILGRIHLVHSTDGLPLAVNCLREIHTMFYLQRTSKVFKYARFNRLLRTAFQELLLLLNETLKSIITTPFSPDLIGFDLVSRLSESHTQRLALKKIICLLLRDIVFVQRDHAKVQEYKKLLQETMSPFSWSSLQAGLPVKNTLVEEMLSMTVANRSKDLMILYRYQVDHCADDFVRTLRWLPDKEHCLWLVSQFRVCEASLLLRRILDDDKVTFEQEPFSNTAFCDLFQEIDLAVKSNEKVPPSELNYSCIQSSFDVYFYIVASRLLSSYWGRVIDSTLLLLNLKITIGNHGRLPNLALFEYLIGQALQDNLVLMRPLFFRKGQEVLMKKRSVLLKELQTFDPNSYSVKFLLAEDCKADEKTAVSLYRRCLALYPEYLPARIGLMSVSPENDETANINLVRPMHSCAALETLESVGRVYHQQLRVSSGRMDSDLFSVYEPRYRLRSNSSATSPLWLQMSAGSKAFHPAGWYLWMGKRKSTISTRKPNPCTLDFYLPFDWLCPFHDYAQYFPLKEQFANQSSSPSQEASLAATDQGSGQSLSISPPNHPGRQSLQSTTSSRSVQLPPGSSLMAPRRSVFQFRSSIHPLHGGNPLLDTIAPVDYSRALGVTWKLPKLIYWFTKEPVQHCYKQGVLYPGRIKQEAKYIFQHPGLNVDERLSLLENLYRETRDATCHLWMDIYMQILRDNWGVAFDFFLNLIQRDRDCDVDEIRTILLLIYFRVPDLNVPVNENGDTIQASLDDDRWKSLLKERYALCSTASPLFFQAIQLELESLLEKPITS